MFSLAKAYLVENTYMRIGWGTMLHLGNLLPTYLFAKRDRVSICVDILETLRNKHEGKRKTNIMQSANLSTDQIRKYLELLYLNGMVRKDGNAYQLTRRGAEFLEVFERLNLTLK
jgi:predicted transcriptional regulator